MSTCPPKSQWDGFCVPWQCDNVNEILSIHRLSRTNLVIWARQHNRQDYHVWSDRGYCYLHKETTSCVILMQNGGQFPGSCSSCGSLNPLLHKTDHLKWCCFIFVGLTLCWSYHLTICVKTFSCPVCIGFLLLGLQVEIWCIGLLHTVCRMGPLCPGSLGWRELVKDQHASRRSTPKFLPRQRSLESLLPLHPLTQTVIMALVLLHLLVL